MRRMRFFFSAKERWEGEGKGKKEEGKGEREREIGSEALAEMEKIANAPAFLKWSRHIRFDNFPLSCMFSFSSPQTLTSVVRGHVIDMQSVTTQLGHLIVHAKLDLQEAGSNAKVRESHLPVPRRYHHHPLRAPPTTTTTTTTTILNLGDDTSLRELSRANPESLGTVALDLTF